MKKIGILLLVIVMSMLSACGGEKPDTAVTNGLNAVKALDTKTMQAYFDAEGMESFEENNVSESNDQDETLKKLLSKMEYSITETKEDGDKAVVTADITAVDMKLLMGEYMQDMLGLAFSGISEDEMEIKAEEMMVDLFSREDNATITTTVDFQLKKADDSWKIQLSDELLDAILGGLISYGNQLNDAFDQ